jgi:hypothetical protein
MILKTTTLLIITIICCAFVAFAAEKHVSEKDLGSAQMILPGGIPGDVPFNHRLHQEHLNDCTLCHDLFPEKAGIIEKLKAENKLKKKQVMNIQCVRCHRDTKREGKDSGPITCSGCHSIK